jgi:hypothetical protein
MKRDIHLFFEGNKIGILNHRYVYDDELNSGRELCEGCLLILHDFKYRVISKKETEEGYEVQLTASNV